MGRSLFAHLYGLLKLHMTSYQPGSAMIVPKRPRLLPERRIDVSLLADGRAYFQSRRPSTSSPRITPCPPSTPLPSPTQSGPPALLTSRPRRETPSRTSGALVARRTTQEARTRSGANGSTSTRRARLRNGCRARVSCAASGVVSTVSPRWRRA
jgi:hypothetical protein